MKPCWDEVSLGLRLAEGTQLRPLMVGLGTEAGGNKEMRGLWARRDGICSCKVLLSCLPLGQT